MTIFPEDADARKLKGYSSVFIKSKQQTKQQPLCIFPSLFFPDSLDWDMHYKQKRWGVNAWGLPVTTAKRGSLCIPTHDCWHVSQIHENTQCIWRLTRKTWLEWFWKYTTPPRDLQSWQAGDTREPVVYFCLSQKGWEALNVLDTDHFWSQLKTPES